MDNTKPLIVTGIPRSGTSMVMQMLIAGGMGAVYNTNLPANDYNPNGYFEPTNWKTDLPTANGKAIKLIIPIVNQTTTGDIIWITRNPDEIYLSERGHAANTQAGTEAFYAREIAATLKALTGRSILNLVYGNVIANPTQAAQQIANFVGGNLDVVKMAAAVNPALYRSKVTS